MSELGETRYNFSQTHVDGGHRGLAKTGSREPFLFELVEGGTFIQFFILYIFCTVRLCVRAAIFPPITTCFSLFFGGTPRRKVCVVGWFV